MLMEPSGGIGSPACWFSAVGVALLVHLAASYLKPRIDHVLLLGSSWWRSRSTARLAAQDVRLAILTNDERAMAFGYFRATYYLLFAVALLTVAIAPLVLLMSPVLASVGLRSVIEAAAVLFLLLCGSLGLTLMSQASSAYDDLLAAEARRTGPHSPS